MQQRIIECVPNFSVGRDSSKVERIAEFYRQQPGIKLLNVDPGIATNRTVYTYAGEAEAVAEATVGGFRLASEIIDMRQHSGTHPRIGAVDVCPFVPISGISLEECAELARGVARRVGEELGIPVYCYEAAAYRPERRNLADCRKGEYEGLRAKMALPDWRPDFGPATFNDSVARSGLSVIGARKFLVAINFNLSNEVAGNALNGCTPDNYASGSGSAQQRSVGMCSVQLPENEIVTIAKNIAADVRESGRMASGARVAGLLKKCKAIGWWIAEYGCAQVSMNLTDIDVTPPRLAYDTVCAVAKKYGARITGSELIGLVPRAALSPDDAIHLNLSDLRPFDYRTRVIDYLL